MILLLTFLLIVVACTLLCLSLAKHYRHLTKRALDDRLKLRLRIAGYGLLSASLAVVFVGESYLGLVYWCGLFSLVAAPLPFIIAYLDGPIRLK